MNAKNSLAQVPPPWVSAHWPFLVFNTIDSYLWAFLNFHHHVYPWVFLSFHHHRHPWVLLNFHHHHGSSSIFTTIDLYLLAFSIFLIMDFIHEHSLLFTTMDPTHGPTSTLSFSTRVHILRSFIISSPTILILGLFIFNH